MTVSNGANADSVSEWFWNLIRLAARDKDKLRELLMPLSKEELERFGMQYREAMDSLTEDRYMDRVADNVTEDDEEDLLGWIVAQGKEYYLDIVMHPANMPPRPPKKIGKQGLRGVAEVVYFDKFGDIPEYL